MIEDLSHNRDAYATGPSQLRIMNNLFAEIPSSSPEELFETLLEQPGIRIERILSFGQASPEGFWYEQENGEWVVLLQGDAALRFEDEAQPSKLKAGDFVFIPAQTRHRVEWTSSEPPAVWLAVHFGPLMT
jgi:cupin 2 domain-containing protein